MSVAAPSGSSSASGSATTPSIASMSALPSSEASGSALCAPSGMAALNFMASGSQARAASLTSCSMIALPAKIVSHVLARSAFLDAA